MTNGSQGLKPHDTDEARDKYLVTLDGDLILYDDEQDGSGTVWLSTDKPAALEDWR